MQNRISPWLGFARDRARGNIRAQQRYAAQQVPPAYCEATGGGAAVAGVQCGTRVRCGVRRGRRGVWVRVEKNKVRFFRNLSVKNKNTSRGWKKTRSDFSET